VDDADVMHLLKVMLKASGKQGVPQGGVIGNPKFGVGDSFLRSPAKARRYGRIDPADH
jgi:hypothetical protein